MRELLNTLYALTPGTGLHLDGDAIRVVKPDTQRRTVLPLARIDHVIAFGGTTVSDDLVCRLGSDDKSVTWLTGPGRILARTTGPLQANPHLRLGQYRAHDQPEQRLTLARWIVAGKLQNTRQVLLRAARDTAGTRSDHLLTTAERIAERLKDLVHRDTIEAILGTEGITAREYVACWPHLISTNADIDPRAKRVTRPATDPFNAALNFGYALLRNAVHGALESVGLDPYIGYLHGIRPGKPALALDLMEEFRALLVDRTILTLFNRRQLTIGDFTTHANQTVELTDEGRRTLLDQWSQERRREWRHPLFQKPIPGALLPLVQARILARHLRGDTDTYLPWSPR